MTDRQSQKNSGQQAPDLLKVSGLRVHFHNAVPERYAVNGVSFSLKRGETLGIVGESGSGKTVTAMCVSGLMPRGKADEEGSILLDGREMFSCSEENLRRIRGQDVGVVFQDPMTTFDPLCRIGRQVEEALTVRGIPKMERRKRAVEAMGLAGLRDAEELYSRYPYELSGGMLQRASIAAAMITKPKLLICDEVTTALDVLIQEQILELLRNLNEDYGMTILFISHDLHVVKKICKSVLVMERGKIVERGETAEVFARPQHAYTKTLIASIPARAERCREVQDI